MHIPQLRKSPSGGEKGLESGGRCGNTQVRIDVTVIYKSPSRVTLEDYNRRGVEQFSSLEKTGPHFLPSLPLELSLLSLFPTSWEIVLIFFARSACTITNIAAVYKWTVDFYALMEISRCKNARNACRDIYRDRLSG